jgi:hypothetical protein
VLSQVARHLNDEDVGGAGAGAGAGVAIKVLDVSIGVVMLSEPKV